MRVSDEIAPFSLNLNARALLRLDQYHAILMAGNQQMDLTKVPEEEMPVRHYADSLLPIKLGLIPPDASIIDVGSGAGFPGLIIAIARPKQRIVLLESMKKRCQFLQDAIDQLELPCASVVCGRAEDLARGSLRESFDLALARAVAPLDVLAEYLLPFVKTGGRALCWKGPAIQDELLSCARACQTLGGAVGEQVDLNIPGRGHLIQALEKLTQTPQKYPRKAGIPAKNPLGG